MKKTKVSDTMPGAIQFVFWGWRSWDFGFDRWPVDRAIPFFRSVHIGPIELRFWR